MTRPGGECRTGDGGQGQGVNPIAHLPFPLSTPQPSESVREVAIKILTGEAFRDEDAVRVASAYLRALERNT